MPAWHGPHFDAPPSGHRVPTSFAWADVFPNMFESVSRRRDLNESRCDPRQYQRGEPRVQFHLNRRLLASKKLSEATGEGPLPSWKLAHEVKKTAPRKPRQRVRAAW